ncbi:MAG: aspartate carbamoyltransferase catalytic subunit [Gammaproteobacteria bacterium WSBS_2016_MAG_OTU1]
MTDSKESSLKDNSAASLQTAADGNLRHLLTLQNIPLTWLSKFFTHADECAAGNIERSLAGKLFVNIFFESSTRTRTAFEAAAKQLGADVVNLDQITMAGESKGESLEDTVRTVAAMGATGIALRHSQSGAAVLAAQAADEFGIAVINGGTGCESHPTQGLTDAYTLREIFGEDLSAVSVAIVGDVLHSRVARSNTQILRAMGVKNIRLIGPPGLCPPALKEEFDAPVFDDLDEGLAEVDVVILLRVQRERIDSYHLTIEDYFANYGLSETRLAKLKAEAVIMHPGPINRGIEISNAVADGKQSKILRQVTNGMAIRKAALLYFCGGKS